jgi:rare lipoprotein A (peptidoglycan hydrolase)
MLNELRGNRIRVAQVKHLLLVGVCAFFLSSQVAWAAPLSASFYSRESLIKEGTWKNGKERLMANGQRFNDNNFTVATRLWPLGTWLRVTNLQNNKVVVVKVTDRIGKRFADVRIDLSKSAFYKLTNGHLELGLIPISVEVIK